MAARADILLKLEFFNPLSSVKDRIGRAMIDAATRAGKNQRGHVSDRTHSGNTGIALAFVRRRAGCKLILTIAGNHVAGTSQTLKILGRPAGAAEAPRHARRDRQGRLNSTRQIPNSVILQQFANPANPEIHRQTTAEEIWRDTDGKSIS